MATVAPKRKRPKRKQHSPQDPPNVVGFIVLAQRAGSIRELTMLWSSAVEWDCATTGLRDAMSQRADNLRKRQSG